MVVTVNSIAHPKPVTRDNNKLFSNLEKYFANTSTGTKKTNAAISTIAYVGQ